MDLPTQQATVIDSEQETPTPEVNNSPKRSLRIPFLVATLIILTGLAGYLYLSHFMPKKIAQLPPPTAIPSPSPTPISTSRWKTYSNAEMGVTFRYPEETSPLNMKNGVIGFFEESSIREKCKTELDQKVYPSKSACFLTKFSLNGLQRFTEAEYKEYQAQMGSPADQKTFTDKQNRVWQTDQLLGEGYNFSAVTLLDNQTYVINFQSRNDLRNIFDQILSTVQFFEKNQTVSAVDTVYEVSITNNSGQSLDQILATHASSTVVDYLSTTVFGIERESMKGITYDWTSKNNDPYDKKNATKVFQIVVEAKQPVLLDTYTSDEQEITVKQLPNNQTTYLRDAKYCQVDADCFIRSNFCQIGGYNKYHPVVDVWGCGPPNYEISPNTFKSSTEIEGLSDPSCGQPEYAMTSASCVNNKCQANGFIACPNRSK